MTDKNSQTAFRLDVQDNGVGIITIDVPNESMNVLKAEFAEQIEAVFAEVKANGAIKGLVITLSLIHI